MVETAELKAFRENIALAQMRGWLVLPAEAPWLNSLVADVVATIRRQWVDEIPDDQARARSKWLLKIIDLRNWAGEVAGGAAHMARYGLATAINSLLLTHSDVSEDGVHRLMKWLREDVLDPLKVDEPATYEGMLETFRAVLVGQLASMGQSDG